MMSLRSTDRSRNGYSPMMTVAPSEANAREVSKPMPEAPPYACGSIAVKHVMRNGLYMFLTDKRAILTLTPIPSQKRSKLI